MSFNPFTERYHRYNRKDIHYTDDNQGILTPILKNIQSTVSFPVEPFIGSGVERTEDESLSDPSDIYTEVEDCFCDADCTVVENLRTWYQRKSGPNIRPLTLIFRSVRAVLEERVTSFQYERATCSVGIRSLPHR